MHLLPRVNAIAFSVASLVMLSACSNLDTKKVDEENNPRTVDKTVQGYKNPFKNGTHEHFVANRDYPGTYATFKDETLLNSKEEGKRRVLICLQEQRGRLYVGNKVAMDFPVSTGVRAHPTSTGSYQVLSKKPYHSSNLYGKIYSASGKCINSNAESSDSIPEGARYVGSPMPYWQRLTNAGLGLHVGRVRRTPQSHGCIRMQRDAAKILYAQTSIGTSVIIRQTPESRKSPFEAPPVRKERPAKTESRKTVKKIASKDASSEKAKEKTPDKEVSVNLETVQEPALPVITPESNKEPRKEEIKWKAQ